MPPLNPTVPEGDGHTDYHLYDDDQDYRAKIQAIIDRVSGPDWLETYMGPKE